MTEPPTLGSDIVPSVIAVRDGRVVASQGNVTDAGGVGRMVAQQRPE
jgi:hypothetical protein